MEPLGSETLVPLPRHSVAQMPDLGSPMPIYCCSRRPISSSWKPGKPQVNKILMRARRTPVVARMLRDGYISRKSCDFLPMADRLAHILHCLMESVACPMASCADADSRAGYRQRFDDVEVMTRVPAAQQTI